MALTSRFLLQLSSNAQTMGKRLVSTARAAQLIDSMPMSKYIGTDFEIKAYTKAQEHHAGRLQGRREIIELLRKNNAETIVEMGTGPGNSLEDMSDRLPDSCFIGLDCDDQYLAEAQSILKHFSTQIVRGKPRVQLLKQYVQAWIPPEKQDAFVALGAFTDLAQDPSVRIHFLKEHCAKHILKPGGSVYIEEEIFPMHNATDKRSRALAAWRQRGSIILDALLQERSEEDVLTLANLELKALISSIHDIGDHKATLTGFISELQNSGLNQIQWKKIWPQPGHLIAVQQLESLPIDSKQGPDNNMRFSRIWDYYSSIILKSAVDVDPHGNIDTDPNYLKAAHAVNDCYYDFQVIKGTTANFLEFLIKLRDYGLQFKGGQLMKQDENDPMQDVDGGVYIFTAKTSH